MAVRRPPDPSTSSPSTLTSFSTPSLVELFQSVGELHRAVPQLLHAIQQGRHIALELPSTGGSLIPPAV